MRSYNEDWDQKYNNNPEALSRLAPERYRVARTDGTERPFANEYWDKKEPGLYVDVVSGETLFASSDKFDSGGGGPHTIEVVGEQATCCSASCRVDWSAS